MHGEDNRRCPPDGWHALGLMSGTSVDGLDVASVRFHQNAAGTWTYDFDALATLAYPQSIRDALWNVMTLNAEQLARLDHEWGVWVGREVQHWLRAQGIAAPHVVGSHGHTVFHKPDEGWTTQIGSGAALHAALGVPVVCDLRRLDMAFGGQGAPLVPLADEVLFGTWDVALNLGGFANLSLQHPNRGRVAWDVGPANLLLNMLAQTRGLDMDRDGKIAQQGTVLSELLTKLVALPHHQKTPPKSLGREWLETQVWPHVGEALGRHSLEDVMATAVEYVATTVVRDVPSGSTVLVTGGGAKNQVLMDAIHLCAESRNHALHVPDAMLVDGKEALVFAWLGLLRWLGLPNALPSVTGAHKATSGGVIWGANAR